MIKKRFKEYFNFTRRERNGLFVLLLILFILIFVNAYVNNKTYGSIVQIDKKFQEDVENFEKSLELIESKEIQKVNSYNKNKKYKKASWKIVENPFDFDPNTIKKTQLKKLGFSNSQIKVLLNYRKTGGVFYEKEDLLKIYGIKERQYKHLEAYIKIKKELKEKPDYVSQKETLIQVEINSANTEEIIELKGVGDSYAKRILKYRDLLGGYIDKNQLLEVYGMDSSRFFMFSEQIVINDSLIIKMNVNKVKFKTLLKHPYLNKYQVQSIMKYRELIGKFERIEQIYENNLLSKEDYFKIEPYITIID
ncbi:MAG: helix-hairpin-helix domain-containing protein [Bacteroidales bacterium]|nr:helix-hairpin-helix domain-containing protein [Bacteroidales bacterium]